MSLTDYEAIQGKDIEILRLALERSGNKLMLTMEVESDNKNIQINFNNVSQLNLRNISFPAQISGLEIINNKSKGWESSNRFKINDFEDGCISFYCEEITMEQPTCEGI